MNTPTCRNCGKNIVPDDMYLFISGQNWEKWVHEPKHYYCFPQQKDSPRAEPEDWEKARDQWIGELHA